MRNHGYLGRTSRLSQAWLSAPLVLLIIMVVKLMLLHSFIQSFLSTAQDALVSECNVLNGIYQAATIAPEEAIEMANQLITASINHSISEAKKTISSSLTAIESLVTFAFEMTLGTYSCLTLSAINIGANEALNATESTVRVANAVAGDIGKEINLGLNELSKFINSAVGLISSIESYFNEGTSKIKNISLLANRLNNISIPETAINTKLESLRNDIPSYQKAKDFIKKEVSLPFTELQQKLSSSNLSVSLAVPIPPPHNSLSPLQSFPQCDFESINKMFGRIRGTIHRLTLILCILCSICMVVGIIYNFWQTDRSWKRTVAAASSDTPIISLPHNANLEETNMCRLAYLQSNFFERFLIKKKLVSIKQLWWIRYVSRRPLLDYFIVGFSGIIISLLELSLIATVKAAYSELSKLEHAAIKDVSQQFKASFDTWRNQTNNNIVTIENNINSQLLGWLYQGSQGVNNTLAHFSDAINDDILEKFNNTMLYEPLQASITCLIGNKISEVEKGLTWLHRSSHIVLPKINNNITFKHNNSTIKKIDSTVISIIRGSLKYLNHAIHMQLIISSIFLSVWLFYSLCAGVIFLGFKDFVAFYKNMDKRIEDGTVSPGIGGSMSLEKAERIKQFQMPLSSLSIHKDSSVHRPSKLAIISDDTQFDYSIMSWEENHNSSFDYHSNDLPPKMIIPSELHTIPPQDTRSPMQRFQNRITQYFNGPIRKVTMATLRSPTRGSIHLPDDPATPLKAMIY